MRRPDESPKPRRRVAALALAALAAACSRSSADDPAGTARAEVPRVAFADLEAPLVALLKERVAAVEAAPGDAGRWGALAIAYDAHDFPAEALACYARAEALAPADPTWSYLGGTCAAATDAAGARAWFDRAQARGSQHPPLFVQRGLARLAAGEVADARADLERATTLDPALVAGWLGLARARLAEGVDVDVDLDGAEAALARATTLGPRSGELHGLAAEVLRRRGDADGAARELARAEGLAPREPLPDALRARVAEAGVTLAWVQRRATAAFERGDAAAAVELWRIAAERSPEDARVLVGAAEAYVRAADGARAKEALARARARLGADGDAALRARVEAQAGVVALAEGDWSAAAGALEAALALDPEDAVVRGNLGLARLQEGNTAAGLEHLRRASAALGPDSPARKNLLGAVLDLRLWHEAQPLIAEALAARPDDPELVFLDARVLAGLGRYAEAARRFARVAELEPGRETAPVNEARALLAAGDEPGAAAALRAAHERLPDSVLVMQRLAWLLATARDAAVVDGETARALARRVLGTQPRNPEFTELAAAAFAAAGDDAPAVTHQQIAIQLLEQLPEGQAPPHREQLLARMRERLEVYRAGKRWVEPAPR